MGTWCPWKAEAELGLAEFCAGPKAPPLRGPVEHAGGS